tara:strand:- start:1092 stop:1328 length:237 start_codon:yes stop_codon:yes gene_type:complete
MKQTHNNHPPLTPLEKHRARIVSNAHYMSLIIETQLLLEGLEKAKDADPSQALLLEALADEAIISLAQEMQDKHGVSA